MGNRVTIKDIAREVGVSAITVSKALNGMPQVSDKMRARIIETAKKMNYNPNLSAKSLVRKEIRIACVYPEEPYEFYSYVYEGVRRAEEDMRDLKCSVRYYPFSSIDSSGEVRKCLEQVYRDGTDGVLLTGNHNYGEYTEILRRITAAGKPVLYNTICGENVPGVIGAIRLNAVLAGQIAADFHGITKSFVSPDKPWKTVIFVGNKNVSTHGDCIDGFMERAARYGIEVVGAYETNEDKNIAYYLTGKVLENTPDLNGIYISSYNALGVCKWLKEHEMQDKILTIGHDLYPALNRVMEEGTLKATLFQNQFEYGREGLKMLFEYITGTRSIEKCTKFMTPYLVTTGMLPVFPEYNVLSGRP